MPAKRHGTKSAQRSSQPTLSFNGRSSKITKPSLVPSGKPIPANTKEELLTKSKTKSPKREEDAATVLKLPKREAQQEPLTSSIDDSASPTKEIVEDTSEPEDPQEVSARKVSDKEIIRYWQKKEEERKAPRVHQKELNIHEKILREWDMSGQYGSCMGITRQKRWHRAYDLGLNPPLVVLAVLQRQSEDGNAQAQRAHVDELMRSRFIET